MNTILFPIPPECSAGDCSAPPTQSGVSLQPGCTVVAWWCEDHASAVNTAKGSAEDQMFADYQELIGDDDQERGGLQLIMSLLAIANQFGGRELTSRALELLRRHPTMFTTLQDQMLDYVSSPEAEEEYERRVSEPKTTKTEGDEDPS